ncbi:hypothetical protein N0V90_007131 [Kalmusia sp. IMI 367209]|nr:hypothetical protein N0V90_007131 [Kalmusia sp. IMI 367209]
MAEPLTPPTPHEAAQSRPNSIAFPISLLTYYQSTSRLNKMTESSKTKPDGDVIANINYFPATGIPIPTSSWKRRYLGVSDTYTRPMTVHDARQTSKTFMLDTHGFQLVKLPPKERVTAASDEETIKRTYYPEIEELVKTLTGASTAFIFNHVIRAHSAPSDKGVLDAKGRWQDIPSGHAHVDYSGDPAHIAATQLEISLPPHVSALYSTSTRFAYLGAWRPLSTIQRDPLAVCDATSVPDEDYQVRLREFRSGVRSGNYVISHREEGERHEWWYMSAMRDDEIVVFKGYDSLREGAWRCPHTAFELEGTEGLRSRESIEVRIVCFWEG